MMAWCRPADKPFSEPMMVRLLTHVCTRPQRVKCINSTLLFMVNITEHWEKRISRCSFETWSTESKDSVYTQTANTVGMLNINVLCRFNPLYPGRCACDFPCLSFSTSPSRSLWCHCNASYLSNQNIFSAYFFCRSLLSSVIRRVHFNRKLPFNKTLLMYNIEIMTILPIQWESLYPENSWCVDTDFSTLHILHATIFMWMYHPSRFLCPLFLDNSHVHHWLS